MMLALAAIASSVVLTAHAAPLDGAVAMRCSLWESSRAALVTHLAIRIEAGWPAAEFRMMLFRGDATSHPIGAPIGETLARKAVVGVVDAPMVAPVKLAPGPHWICIEGDSARAP